MKIGSAKNRVLRVEKTRGLNWGFKSTACSILMIGRVIKPSFLMDSSGAIQLYPPPAVLPTGKRNHSFFKSLDSHIGAIKFFLCHHNLKSKTAKKKDV